MKNELVVDVNEFNRTVKVFKVGMPRKNAKKVAHIELAKLSFSGGFLSIEADDKVAVMHAKGEWNGNAEFSYNIVKALALVPMNDNPLTITYEAGKLTIGRTSTSCNWTLASQEMMGKVTNPSLIDVFAMWKSQPADELTVGGLKLKNKIGREKMQNAVTEATNILAGFEVTQEELINLINAKVTARINHE